MHLYQHDDQGPTSIIADDITVEVKNAVLLDDVSFALRHGTLLGIIGPSGCGKSTLLKAHDRDPAGRPAASCSTTARTCTSTTPSCATASAWCPRTTCCTASSPCAGRCASPPRCASPTTCRARQRRDRVDEVIELLGLTNRAKQRIDTLSGGQRKRTSVALELLTEPSLLALDEPTSGLDPALDKEVMRELRLLADRGRTVVVVTHSVLHLDLCDHVLVMCLGGRMGYFGPPDELLRVLRGRGLRRRLRQGHQRRRPVGPAVPQLRRLPQVRRRGGARAGQARPARDRLPTALPTPRPPADADADAAGRRGRGRRGGAGDQRHGRASRRPSWPARGQSDRAPARRRRRAGAAARPAKPKSKSDAGLDRIAAVVFRDAKAAEAGGAEAEGGHLPRRQGTAEGCAAASEGRAGHVDGAAGAAPGRAAAPVPHPVPAHDLGDRLRPRLRALPDRPADRARRAQPRRARAARASARTSPASTSRPSAGWRSSSSAPRSWASRSRSARSSTRRRSTGGNGRSASRRPRTSPRRWSSSSSSTPSRW